MKPKSLRAMVGTYAKMADPTLTGLLLAVAAILVIIALTAKNPYVKAVVLAWVTFP